MGKFRSWLPSANLHHLNSQAKASRSATETWNLSKLTKSARLVIGFCRKNRNRAGISGTKYVMDIGEMLFQLWAKEGDCLWGPHSLQFNEYRWISLSLGHCTGRTLKLTTNSHLSLSFRKFESSHLLSHLPSCLFVSVATSQRGPRPPHSWGMYITHNDTPLSVGLLWTRDQPVAETSTWQHTTFTRDRHPCPQRNSNPQSQQASSCRPSP